jgi:hypothetical protein
MREDISDRVIVEDRESSVLEVLGCDSAPPYRVRWSDGHETVFVPRPMPRSSTIPLRNDPVNTRL